MRVSPLILLPTTLVLALPLEKKGILPTTQLVNLVESILPDGADGTLDTVFAGLPDQLDKVKELVTSTGGTVFAGLPDQLGSVKDIVSETLDGATPGGVPSTLDSLFAGLKGLFGNKEKRGLLLPIVINLDTLGDLGGLVNHLGAGVSDIVGSLVGSLGDSLSGKGALLGGGAPADESESESTVQTA